MFPLQKGIIIPGDFHIYIFRLNTEYVHVNAYLIVHLN